MEIIGVDVSKQKLDIYNSETKKYQTISNTENGVSELMTTIKQDALFVIDLTGGYEVLLKEKLYENGYHKIILAEGIKVKNFTKGIKSRLAKTDRMDSYILTEYARMFGEHLKYYEPNIKGVKIDKYYSRIIDLKKYKQQEKNRYKQPNLNEYVKEDIKETIEFLETKIENITNKLLKIIKEDYEYNRLYETLLQEKGIGEETAISIIALLPELGKTDRKKIAAICGVAPRNHDSGSSIHYHRYTGGGRPLLKKKLFMIVLSMIRYNKEYQSKIETMVSKGKCKMVAIVALMRIFIIRLNAEIKRKLYSQEQVIVEETGEVVDKQQGQAVDSKNGYEQQISEDEQRDKISVKKPQENARKKSIKK
jgi:transposase